jgi:two-component system NtrC family sensor kinase
MGRIMNRQMMEAGKLVSIGELAAGIMHEMNNLVALMVEKAGWIQDLIADEDLTTGEHLGEIRESLNHIQNQGRRCNELSQRLLGFARKPDTVTQLSHIDQLIQEVIDLTAQYVKANHATIDVRLAADLPPVQVPPVELQQILINLIFNAVAATSDRQGDIKIRSYEEKDYLVIEVADNGIGIPEKNLSAIFEPFFTTKPGGKGTGLGLSICQELLTAFGGSIDVVSILNQGTTFTLKIPVQNKLDRRLSP